MAINDDLNLPKALAVVWDLIKDQSLPGAAKKQSLLKFDSVLGLNLKPARAAAIPPAIRSLADQRQAARQAKDYPAADRLRQEIEKQGYLVEDKPKSYSLKVKRK